MWGWPTTLERYPHFSKKLDQHQKYAAPPKNDCFRGSFTSVTRDHQTMMWDESVGWFGVLDHVFLWKKQKRMYHHCMVSQNIPKTRVQFAFFVFWSIWKWSRRSSEKKPSKTHKKNTMSTWKPGKQRPQKRKWKLSHLDLFTVIFLLSTILGRFISNIWGQKKMATVQGSGFLGKLDVFTD